MFSLGCPRHCTMLRFFCFFILFFFKDFIYLREREQAQVGREAGRGRGRSRLPAEQGARRGARSQDPGTMTWAEGRRSTTEPPRRHQKSKFLDMKQAMDRILGILTGVWSMWTLFMCITEEKMVRNSWSGKWTWQDTAFLMADERRRN